MWDERLIIKKFHFLDVLFVHLTKWWTFSFEHFSIYVLRLILLQARFYENENDLKMITISLYFQNKILISQSDHQLSQKWVIIGRISWPVCPLEISKRSQIERPTDGPRLKASKYSKWISTDVNTLYVWIEISNVLIKSTLHNVHF